MNCSNCAGRRRGCSKLHGRPRKGCKSNRRSPPRGYQMLLEYMLRTTVPTRVLRNCTYHGDCWSSGGKPDHSLHTRKLSTGHGKLQIQSRKQKRANRRKGLEGLLRTQAQGGPTYQQSFSSSLGETTFTKSWVRLFARRITEIRPNELQ